MSRSEHTKMVLMLYKGILKIHKGLPSECRLIGDQYVKDEFRRHKNVNTPEASKFLQEWTNYYLTVAKQLGKRVAYQRVGRNLSEEELEKFKDDQLGQLYTLFEAATEKDGQSKT